MRRHLSKLRLGLFAMACLVALAVFSSRARDNAYAASLLRDAPPPVNAPTEPASDQERPTTPADRNAAPAPTPAPTADDLEARPGGQPLVRPPSPNVPELVVTHDQIPPGGGPDGSPEGGEPEAPIFDANTARISFQAVLTDNAGNALPGPVNLRFQIYTYPGGVAVGAFIDVLGVPVNDGVVDTHVPVPASSFDGTGRQMGVRVNLGVELTPRIQLTAVPYAYRVDRVLSAELDDNIELGTPTTSGSLELFSATNGGTGVFIDGNFGDIQTFGTDGLIQTRLWNGSWGELLLYDNTDNNQTVVLSATSNSGGSLTLRDATGGNSLVLNGGDGTVNAEGSLDLVSTIGGTTLASVQSSGNGGWLRTFDAAGAATGWFGSSAGSGGFINLNQTNAITTINIDGDANNANGGGLIQVRNAVGTTTITLDGDLSGDGRITTQELSITGGSDLSEQFDVRSNEGEIKPGMVVCIDAKNPGKLLTCSKTYDRTVAGVISGAGGVKPGMMMGQAGSVADGTHPVALTGRVYCLVDASKGGIEPGDLLTTSDTPGHAMKVSDHGKATGAIIGKAMTSLTEGKGLVLVLVSLQ